MAKANHLRGALLAGVSAALLAGGAAQAAETVINIPADVTLTSALAVSPAAGDSVTVNIDGRYQRSTTVGSGAGPVVFNNDGWMETSFNFASSTSDLTINVTRSGQPTEYGWRFAGNSNFGQGTATINNGPDGAVIMSGSRSWQFGAGSDDRFVNEGRLILGITGVTALFGGGYQGVSFTIDGLDHFENSGLIIMGGLFQSPGQPGSGSFGTVGDILIAHGVNFVGSGDSRIALDAFLDDRPQAACPTSISAPGIAADCIDFTGGTTDGVTQLIVTDSLASSTNGALNDGVVLVMGSSAAENFVLSPQSDHYVETADGPVLQKRFVSYRLAYDETAKTHSLVSDPSDEAAQPASFIGSLQETWRSTANGFLDRQADLRMTPGGFEPSNGLWMRIGGSKTERDASTTIDAGGSLSTHDLSNSQRIVHLVAGADILGADTQDAAWTAGLMAGYVRSDVEYDSSPNETVTNGFTGGLYASYLAGPLFVDALVNTNLVHMRADMPRMEFGLGVPLKLDAASVGAQIEAGWRIEAGAGFVEPLVGASIAATRIQDVDLPGGGGTVDFESAYTSARLGGGVRAGAMTQMMGLDAAFSLTARYWNEAKADNVVTAVLANGGDRLEALDDFGGGFSEVSGSVQLFGADGGWSGFANLGGRFGDGYSGLEGAVGMRLRW